LKRLDVVEPLLFNLIRRKKREAVQLRLLVQNRKIGQIFNWFF